MKILILVRSLTSGGEQRVASLWTKGFIERGHKVVMVLGCAKKTPLTYQVPPQTIIYHINNTFAYYLYKLLGFNFFYTRKLRKIITKCQPNIIISLYHPWTEWAKESTLNMDIPIVSTEHTTFERPDSAKMSPQTYKFKYEYNKHYDYVTVLTAADKRCLQNHIDNVFVMPNPLAFSPVKDIPKKENIIIVVGQLHSWHNKGLDLIIEAWGTICKKYPDWKLQIAGGDRNNSKKYLLSIVQKYDAQKQIEFIGFQNNIQPFFQRSSIFVLSSRYEGFGMALTEAMSQGCACIACDYKGRQQEIIGDNCNGIICPTENTEALAEALQVILNDKEKRFEYQKNAIERSKYYCLDNIMDKWEVLLKK